MFDVWFALWTFDGFFQISLADIAFKCLVASTKSGLHCSVWIGRFYTALDFSQFCLRLICVWQKVLTFRVLHINFLLWGFILFVAFLQTVEGQQFLRFVSKKHYETVVKPAILQVDTSFFSHWATTHFSWTNSGSIQFHRSKGGSFFKFFCKCKKNFIINFDFIKFWKITSVFSQLFWLLPHVNWLKIKHQCTYSKKKWVSCTGSQPPVFLWCQKKRTFWFTFPTQNHKMF